MVCRRGRRLSRPSNPRPCTSRVLHRWGRDGRPVSVNDRVAALQSKPEASDASRHRQTPTATGHNFPQKNVSPAPIIPALRASIQLYHSARRRAKNLAALKIETDTKYLAIPNPKVLNISAPFPIDAQLTNRVPTTTYVHKLIAKELSKKPRPKPYTPPQLLMLKAHTLTPDSCPLTPEPYERRSKARGSSARGSVMRRTRSPERRWSMTWPTTSARQPWARAGSSPSSKPPRLRR